MKKTFFLITLLFFSFFTDKKSNALETSNQPIKPSGQYLVCTQIQNFYDKKRNRVIPVQIYWPNNNKSEIKLSPKLIAQNIKATTIPGFYYAQNEKNIILKQSSGIVLINPGNGVAMTDYSYLATELASHGFFVVTIANQLKDDPKLITKKTLKETRMPAWQRGVDNNLAVLVELKNKDFVDMLDFNNITLIGHSLGGDMVMLFATEHPDLVKNIISLDNLRINFPDQKKPRMMILRNQKRSQSSNVNDDILRAKKFGQQLIFIPGATHRAFSDEGDNWVKSQINKAVIGLLEPKLAN